MYKEDLALNNLQWLMCHKTQPKQIIYIQYICIKRIWHYITYNGWYAIKLNQPKPNLGFYQGIGFTANNPTRLKRIYDSILIIQEGKICRIHLLDELVALVSGLMFSYFFEKFVSLKLVFSPTSRSDQILILPPVTSFYKPRLQEVQ